MAANLGLAIMVILIVAVFAQFIFEYLVATGFCEMPAADGAEKANGHGLQRALALDH